MLGCISKKPQTRLSLLLLAVVLLASCGGRENSNSSTDRQLALEKATTAITDAGHMPTNYTHQESFDTNSGRWTFIFQPKAKPRPPGGDLLVWVNLATGETKLMQGQ